jgi:hypothetical protein
VRGNAVLHRATARVYKRYAALRGAALANMAFLLFFSM